MREWRQLSHSWDVLINIHDIFTMVGIVPEMWNQVNLDLYEAQKLCDHRKVPLLLQEPDSPVRAHSALATDYLELLYISLNSHIAISLTFYLFKIKWKIHFFMITSHVSNAQYSIWVVVNVLIDIAHFQHLKVPLDDAPPEKLLNARVSLLRRILLSFAGCLRLPWIHSRVLIENLLPQLSYSRSCRIPVMRNSNFPIPW